MIEISLIDLAGVTAGGAPPRGTPIFGRIGWYEQLKNIGGSLHRRVIDPSGHPGKWKRYSPSWPNYEGQ